MVKQMKAPSKGGVNSPECLCGCTGVVESTKARFLRGHDAKLKGLLIRVARGDLPTSSIPAVAMPLLTEGDGVAGITVQRLGGGKLAVRGVKESSLQRPAAKAEKEIPPGPPLPAKAPKKGAVTAAAVKASKPGKKGKPAPVEDDEENEDEE